MIEQHGRLAALKAQEGFFAVGSYNKSIGMYDARDTECISLIEEGVGAISQVNSIGKGVPQI